MSHIGPLRVPFPFPPYPLQEHAVTELRTFLDASDQAASSSSTRVAVLESPTGTGKSHMLLSSVLSHLFTVCEDVGEDSQGEQPDSCRSRHETASAVAVPPPSLEALLAQRRFEEELREVKSQRRERVRAARRRLRTEARRKAATETEEFLLHQSVTDGGVDRHTEMMAFSSSSASTSSAESSHDDEDESEGDEGVMDKSALLAMVPLRKPKAYFSSRTHTQLQQLLDDVRLTAYGKHKIKAARSTDRGGHDEEDGGRWLRAVHVAGRQQLCINAQIRQQAKGRSDLLNDLCLDAMQYESSAEGKKARRAADRQRARGTAVTNGQSAGDIEDLGLRVGKGCEFCATSRLRAMLDYVESEADPRRVHHSDNDATAPGVMSLEAMKRIGSELRACPYLATRYLVRGADAVFIPYGYLADESQRRVLLGGATTNAVTEAEMDWEEAYDSAKTKKKMNSSDPTLDADIAMGLGELLASRQRQQRRYHRLGGQPQLSSEALLKPPRFSGDVIVLDEAHNVADLCRSVSTASISAHQLQLAHALLSAYAVRYEGRLLTQNKQRIRELVLFLERLMRYMDRTLQSLPPQHIDSSGTAMDHPSTPVIPFTSFVFDADVDHTDVFVFLTFLTETRLFHKLKGLVAHLFVSEFGQDAHKGSPEPTNDSNGKLREVFVSLLSGQGAPNGSNAAVAQAISVATSSLQQLEQFLRWFYQSDKDTRVVIYNANDKSNTDVSLKLIQLEPGKHTLLPLMQKASATILAGGTMQPLALTVYPLLQSQKQQSSSQCPSVETAGTVALISEPHVVPPSSIAVWALGSGPSGRRIVFSQSALAADSASTFSDLALTLLNMLRVLPPAGVVCFFTSYSMLNSFVEHIRACDMYEQMDAVKRIFVEKQPQKQQQGAVSSNNSNNTKSAEGNVFDSYRAWILSDDSGAQGGVGRRGALLLAVMGGSLSEGINFSDDLGRCVVVVGLPYANPSDVELQLYMEHVAAAQTQALDGGSSSSDGAHGDKLARAKWSLYTDICMRSVNQCIGRCIRHVNDYAAVILLDARYVERQDVRSRVPAWMQPSLKTAANFGECFRGVRGFFENRKK